MVGLPDAMFYRRARRRIHPWQEDEYRVCIPFCCGDYLNYITSEDPDSVTEDERAADERAADERAADERAVDERAADERAADASADERAADERVADASADERAADASADERAADERVADASADERAADASADERAADASADERAADERAPVVIGCHLDTSVSYEFVDASSRSDSLWSDSEETLYVERTDMECTNCRELAQLCVATVLVAGLSVIAMAIISFA